VPVRSDNASALSSLAAEAARTPSAATTLAVSISSEALVDLPDHLRASQTPEASVVEATPEVTHGRKLSLAAPLPSPNVPLDQTHGAHSSAPPLPDRGAGAFALLEFLSPRFAAKARQSSSARMAAARVVRVGKIVCFFFLVVVPLGYIAYLVHLMMQPAVRTKLHESTAISAADLLLKRQLLTEAELGTTSRVVLCPEFTVKTDIGAGFIVQGNICNERQDDQVFICIPEDEAPVLIINFSETVDQCIKLIDPVLNEAMVHIDCSKTERSKVHHLRGHAECHRFMTISRCVLGGGREKIPFAVVFCMQEAQETFTFHLRRVKEDGRLGQPIFKVTRFGSNSQSVSIQDNFGGLMGRLEEVDKRARLQVASGVDMSLVVCGIIASFKLV